MSEPQKNKQNPEENCLENSIKISQLFNNLCTPILMACALGTLIFSGAHKVYFQYSPEIKIRTIKSDDSKLIKFLISNSGGQPVVISRAWIDTNFKANDESKKIITPLRLIEDDYILEPNKIHLSTGVSSQLIPSLVEEEHNHKKSSKDYFTTNIDTNLYCKIFVEYIGIDTRKKIISEVFKCLNASILRQPIEND